MEVISGGGKNRPDPYGDQPSKGHCLLQPITSSGPLRLLAVLKLWNMSGMRWSPVPAHLTTLKVRTKHSATVDHSCNVPLAGEFKRQKKKSFGKTNFLLKVSIKPTPPHFYNGMHATVCILTYIFSQYQDLLSLELNESQYWPHCKPIPA